MRLTHTHTYAELDVSAATFAEIRARFDAGTLLRDRLGVMSYIEAMLALSGLDDLGTEAPSASEAQAPSRPRLDLAELQVESFAMPAAARMATCECCGDYDLVDRDGMCAVCGPVEQRIDYARNASEAS